MISISYCTYNMITKIRNKGNPVFFDEWTHEVSIMVDLHRQRLQSQLPNHKVFFIIANEEWV